ncbi:hypothetical protein BH10BAC4_BH10BAC4_04440 [soil metagenome]
MGNSKGFDSVAVYYDWLVRLVFGTSMSRAQTVFLGAIKDCTNVLVLGGGTSPWMTDFLKNRPGCRVVYIEASPRMLNLSKEMASFDKRIDFRLGTEELLSDGDQFDAIVTFCYLDLFSEEELQRVIHTITRFAKHRAIWLATDFVEGRSWHTAMLRIMYIFFKITTGLPNHQLPDWNELLEKNRVKKIDSRLFYGEFISSGLYVFQG